MKDTGYAPDKCFFKGHGGKQERKLPAHIYKRLFVEELLKSGEYKTSDFIAVESNFKTHKQYRELGLTEIYKRDQYLKL